MLISGIYRTLVNVQRLVPLVAVYVVILASPYLAVIIVPFPILTGITYSVYEIIFP